MIPFPSLLEDFEEFSEEFDQKLLLNKARRIWNMCMIRKKHELAKKIEVKYQLKKNRHQSDMAVAMGFVLLSSRQAGNPSS